MLWAPSLKLLTNCSDMQPSLNLFNVLFGQFGCLLFMEGFILLILSLFFLLFHLRVVMPIFIIFNCEFVHLKKQVNSSNTFRQQPKLEETPAKKCIKVFSQEFIWIKSVSESLLKLAIRLRTCYRLYEEPERD